MMKKIFSINMDKGDFSSFDGDSFVTRRTDENLIREYESLSQNDSATKGSSPKEKVFKFAAGFCLGLGAVLLIVLIRALTAGGTFIENFKNGFTNAPYVFILCPLLLALGLVLTIYNKIHDKSRENAENIEQITDDEKEILEKMKENLNISKDALPLDVLCFAYKRNRLGAAMPYSPYATHTPMECFVYRDNDNLYIANYSAVFTFPVSEYRGYRETKADVKLLTWNKSEDLNDPKYSEFSMCYDNYGVVMADGFYSLIFERDGEIYEVDIPKYELSGYLNFLS